MMHAIAEGCISFKIEWTYNEGVGEFTDANGVWMSGFAYADNWPQPWWGNAHRNDPADPSNLGITFNTLQEFYANATGDFDDWYATTPDDLLTDVAAYRVIDGNQEFVINPNLIETSFGLEEGHALAPVPVINEVGASEYWAIFGYNSNQPFAEDGSTLLNFANANWPYTPRPSALRVTLRLLDRQGRMGGAWTYQFVVDLPERE